MTRQHEHLTIEQLSALIDRQVSAQEETAWNAHLRTCEECRQNLAGLRRTSALLRALPQQEAPRSFVLTPELLRASSSDESKREPTRQQRANVVPLRRESAWRRTARGAFRTMSTLAAVLGIVILISGLLPMFSLQVSFNTAAPRSSNSNNSATQPRQPTGVVKPHVTPNTRAQTETAAPHPTPTPVPTPATQQHNPAAQAPPSIDFGQPVTRLALGAALLLLGILALLLTRRRRPRAADGT